MARGFLAGMVWGVVASGIGAAGLSVAVGPAMTVPQDPAETEAVAPELASAAPDAGAPPKVDSTAGEAAAVAGPDAGGAAPGRPDPEAAVTRGDIPADVPPAPADEVAGAAQIVPPAPPEIGAAPDAPADAPAEADPAALAASADAPVPQPAPGAAPDAPAPDAGPDVSTEPAELPVPGEDTAPGPADVVAETPPPEVAAETDADAAEALETAAADADAAGPSIGAPAGSLIDRTPAVPQNRLPSLGVADAEAGDGAAQEVGASDTADRAAPPPPLERFAAKVEAPSDLARLSIILIDDGTGPLKPAFFEAFPFPVTFAIDPAHPDAAAAAAGYRALGFEVMALGDVPQGARPADVEVALAGALDLVPEAVAVLEKPGGGLQTSREVSDQATRFLQASGHGLVTQPKGLNTAQQLAAREGVPSAALFRDFDGEGQDERVIRRFLDNAALRARQDGAVVMQGRLRADTITALMRWSAQDRASTVALVPVSVVLREAAAQ